MTLLKKKKKKNNPILLQSSPNYLMQLNKIQEAFVIYFWTLISEERPSYSLV